MASFLGLALFCGRFIQNFATITEPLWILTRDGQKWDWTAAHEAAFQELKQAIATYAMGFFNILWKSVLTVDASPVGLGAVLSQYNPKNESERHIIAFASRLLSLVERRYSQCEKEGLAIVWGCEKFYLQLFGQKFLLVTDNKAIELIFRNPNSTPPARIERWVLRLSQFDFEIIHKPGKFNIADFFSRHPSESAPVTNAAERYVNMIVSYAIPNSLSVDQVVLATNDDIILQKLIRIVSNTHNLIKINLPIELQDFSHVINDITIGSNGIILRNHQIVIPLSLQRQVLALAHIGHQGIVKTKELLRSKVWFPGINQKVEALIKHCNECQVNQAKQQFEPLKPSVFPNEPWEELSSDFFGPMSDSSYWLVVSDDYSRYPVVKRVCSTSAEVNIPVLEEIFSTFGIPRVFKTDNGPPFQSHKFKEFAERMNFHHRRVTPYWPRSNGEAERFMQNLKKVLKNAQVNGNHKEQELQFFLRAYRATPHCVTKVPPSVLLFGFSKTSGIPSVATRSNEPIHIFARENDNRAKQMMKINYDRVKHVSECPITIVLECF